MTNAIAPADDTSLQPQQYLSAAEMHEAAQIAQALDLHDSNALAGFGIGAQNGLAALADPLLRIVAAKDSGAVGDALSELLSQVRALDTRSLASDGESALSRLPLLGEFFSSLRRFMARYEKVAARVDRIVVLLDKSRALLNHDVALLDTFYEQNATYFRQLLVSIAAGELKLAELRRAHAQAADQARASADPVLAQQVSDLANSITRLERRVHDLRLHAMVALQRAPQIRIIQNGDQALVEKIHSSIMLTIPLWKAQLAMAITLLRQQRATALQRRLTEATNDMLRQSADQLRQGSATVQSEAERGIVSLDTLQHTQSELIATIEDSLRIQAEGRQQRQQAEARLNQMQVELRDYLAGTQPRMASAV